MSLLWPSAAVSPPSRTARAGVAIALVVAEDVAAAARVEAGRLGVTLARAAVVLDDIGRRGFLDVHALVALCVEGVVVDPVRVRLVGVGGGVFAVAALLGRGADIDCLAVFAAAVKAEVVDAAVHKGRIGDLVVLGEVAQPQALAARVSEGHAQHAQAAYAVARGLAQHIQQLIAIARGAGGAAPLPIDRKALEREIVVVDLEDAPIASALQHGVGWPLDRDRRLGCARSPGEQVL